MKLKLNKPRIWILSDTHLGARNNSTEWLELMVDYFDNYFIPLVEKEYKEGDILIHCGDVFDNRQSLNLLVMNKTMNIFERLSKIFKNGIYIICGNHDIHRKNSNDITSLDVLKFIPGIHIFKEPEILHINNHKLLMMPWRINHDEEVECIKNHPEVDYVFCHANITSLNFNKRVVVDTGADIEAFKDVKRVYSGHIHYAQKKKNINMVGNPYQMTRSDIGNEKGINRLDLDSGTEDYFINDYSPKFVKLYLHKCLDWTMAGIEGLCKNNFVDVHVPSEFVMKYQINDFISQLSEIASKLEVMTFEKIDEADLDIEYDKSLNALNLCEQYVTQMSYNPKMKKKLTTKLGDLYNEAIKNEL